MADETFKIVMDVVVEITGSKPENLSAASRFTDILHDEGEFQEIYEEACKRLDVPLTDIINSMPLYRIEAGDFVMTSLRNLAPFSANAHTLLTKYDVCMNDDTIGSVAESMRQKKYVESGQLMPPMNPPRSKFYVKAWVVGLLAAAIGLPLLATQLPCNPVCSDCSMTVMQQMREMLPFSLGLAIFVNAIAFVPGVLAMRSKRGRRVLNRTAS